MFSKTFLTLAATAALVASAPAPPGSGDKTITLCEGPALNPVQPYASVPVVLDTCTNVSQRWNDKATSLKVEGDHIACTFYENYNCDGKSAVVETSHAGEEFGYGEILHLGVAPYNLDKQVSSYSCKAI